MKPFLRVIISLIAVSLCGTTTAQTKKQILTIKTLDCNNGLDCYIEFFDPKTNKSINLNRYNFDDKYEKNWEPARNEISHWDEWGKGVGTEWFIGKKYAITLVYRVEITEEWDEVKEEFVVKKGKVKRWFVTSLKRLT